MIAQIRKDQELSGKDAIQQALQERDECLSHFESLQQFALSRSGMAVHYLVALEYERLEKKWRRDPFQFRDFFAANHLGAATLLSFWMILKNLLEEESLIPSFDMILECVRAAGSSVSIQSINDEGLLLVCQFLVMHESPESVISTWLKISKCLDPDHFQRRFEEFIAAGHDAASCRRAMLEMARAKSAEWQKIADQAQQQFDEIFETLENSTIPACRVDRTLGASLRDAQTRLKHAENRYQKLLKEQAKHDLKKNPKAETDPQQDDPSAEPQNASETEQPQKSESPQNPVAEQNPNANSALVQKHLADFLAAKARHTRATERLCELLEVPDQDLSSDFDDDDLDDEEDDDYEDDDLDEEDDEDDDEN